MGKENSRCICNSDPGLQFLPRHMDCVGRAWERSERKGKRVTQTCPSAMESALARSADKMAKGVSLQNSRG
jgi:hypothetical protein